jgi:hypothetical protein
VVHKYNFGYRHRDDDPGSSYELGAIIGKGGSPQFVSATDALAEIVKAL